MKSHIFLFLLLVTIFNKVTAQEYPTDKGAFMVNGVLSAASYGGKLYEDSEKKRATIILLSPSIDYFFKKNLFCGAAFLYGHEKSSSVKEKTFGIGPEIGYVAAKPNNKILPVISIGYLFSSKKDEYDYGNYDPYSYGYGGYGGSYNSYNYALESYSARGNEIFVTLGVIVPVQKHIGITLGGIFRYQNYISSGIKTSGNIVAFNIGLNGLLYRTTKE